MLKGKKSPFTIERKELLDEMGFDWKVQNRKDWFSRLQELLQYMSENEGSTVSGVVVSVMWFKQCSRNLN
jgi:hypothetical protein